MDTKHTWGTQGIQNKFVILGKLNPKWKDNIIINHSKIIWGWEVGRTVPE